MWIFGYGSLLWKADFPFEEKIYGSVKGYARRFWQISPDHRGTDEKEDTWGCAYRVAEESAVAVRAQLDEREKAGYSLHSALFHPDDGRLAAFELGVYVSPAQHDNFYFAGVQPLDDIAETVVTSEGPSGTNIDYVLRLAACLRAAGRADAHLFGLEMRVRRLCARRRIDDPCLALLPLPPA